jgi:hypothetical protein
MLQPTVAVLMDEPPLSVIRTPGICKNESGERQRQRETDRQRERQRETDRQTERESEKERSGELVPMLVFLCALLSPELTVRSR